MDHIAACAGAGRIFLDKDWFAPDCFDACTDAMRLAKYLDLKGHLYLAKRRLGNGQFPGRLIGRQIDIHDENNKSKVLATYRLYMGEKDNCDSSYPNCEGIAIEYTDVIKKQNVLMMGDVNYASFNKARSANKTDPSFADTRINYLIVPHHGSEHTAYNLITDYDRIALGGNMAIICCTNEKGKSINRPNVEHFTELKKRFGNRVITTEEAKDVSIKIKL